MMVTDFDPKLLKLRLGSFGLLQEMPWLDI